MSGVFRKVMVPVEFEAVTDVELALDRAAEVGDHEWIAIGEQTVHALELAARVAQGGEVWIVHATAEFTDYATWMPPPRVAELDGAASHDSSTLLAKVARTYCPGVTLHFVVEPGKPLDVILAAARVHLPDAIVLAASARRRMSRAFLGSTADKVIRQSSCPVLVVPAGAP